MTVDFFFYQKQNKLEERWKKKIFKVLKGKNFQPRYLYPPKILKILFQIYISEIIGLLQTYAIRGVKEVLHAKRMTDENLYVHNKEILDMVKR